MAKKKARVGRPAKKKTAAQKATSKRAPLKQKRTPQSRKKQTAPGAAAALSAHGLAKWIPQAGDLLVTQTVGTLAYSGRSWRKHEPTSAAPRPQPKAGVATGPAKKRGRPSKAAAEQQAAPAKRGRGRPRKALPGPVMNQALRGQKGQRVIEEVVLEDIEDLDGRISDVA